MRHHHVDTVVALRLGLEHDVFTPSDVVSWAERLMEHPELGERTETIELATTEGEVRSWYLDRLRRLAPADETPGGAAQVVLAAAFLLRQRGVGPRDVAQRVRAATRGMKLGAPAQARFVEDLEALDWSAVLAFFVETALVDAPPCLAELPRVPTLSAVIEPWSRRSLPGSLEAARLAQLRLPHAAGDELTATELLFVDASGSALSELLEHGRTTGFPELDDAGALAANFASTFASLEVKRGWRAEVPSASLVALVGETSLGTGPWLGQMRRFAAHLQTAEVQARLKR